MSKEEERGGGGGGERRREEERGGGAGAKSSARPLLSLSAPIPQSVAANKHRESQNAIRRQWRGGVQRCPSVRAHWGIRIKIHTYTCTYIHTYIIGVTRVKPASWRYFILHSVISSMGSNISGCFL